MPAGVDPARAAALRAEGFATVAALGASGGDEREARRLLCTHILVDGRAVPLKTGG
jgi:ATP phosphoribosyltransferase regulatory subunit